MSETGSPIHKSAIVGGSDGEREIGDERPERMRDWIVRMVNSQRFHGLEWINQEKTIFRVPWIHAKKRGYCKERDAALFREWALHSGKYRDESDPTVWKINFRCAINGLKDIMEIKDMQTEDCRVYKVLPSRSRVRRKARRPRFASTEPYPCGHAYPPEIAVAPHVYSQGSLNSSCFLASLPGSEPVFSIPPPTSSIPYSSAPNIKMEYKPESLPSCSSAGFSPLSLTSMTYCVPTTTLSENHSNYYGSLPPLSVMESVIPIQRQGSPDSGINVDNQNSPLPIVSGPDQATSYCNVPLSSASPTYPSPSYPLSPYSSPLPVSGSVASSPNNSVINDGVEKEIARIVDELEDSSPRPSPIPSPAPPPQQLNIRVFYGPFPVIDKTIICHSGCRVFFDPRYCKGPTIDQAEKFFGPSEAHQIQLPDKHPNVIAQEIFHAMSRGLLIEMINDDIYATPLCRTVVYYGPTTNSESIPLPKEKRTKVFDYSSYFRPALERYAVASGQSPSPFAIFSLGQPWGPNSVSQTLISISVCHSKAKHELETIGLPATLTRDLLTELPDSIDIGKANVSDLQAEAFLTQCMSQVQ